MVDTPTHEFKFTQGDTEWERLRALARTDLYWFADVVLGYGARIPMKEHAHRILCRLIERKTGHAAIDDRRVIKLEQPRETGKTTLMTQAWVLQLLCIDRDLSILLCNEKEQNAQDFLAAIKWQLKSNELLRALFPELIPVGDFDNSKNTWSASRINVARTTGRKEPSVFVIGVGGTVTGMHPDIIIVDDMISKDAMENARAGSWQIMNITNRWINQLWPLIAKTNPLWRLCFIGTRWWHGDSYEHINKAYGNGETPVTYNVKCPLPSGEVQTFPVQVFGDLVVYSRAALGFASPDDGRSAFPEKWSLEDLAKMRMRDEALFACNMMNRPSDERTATFKESWLRRFEWLNERQLTYTTALGKKRVCELGDFDVQFFVDPGGFATRQVEDRARPAVAVVGDDLQGNFLVLDIYNDKDTFVACIEQICAWVTRYGPRRIIVENAGQQIAFIKLLKDALRERGLTPSVEEVKTKGVHKEVRILGLEPFFQRGQFVLGTGAAFHSFLEQYTQFPRTARFDVLDVLAYVPQFVRLGARGKPRNHAERQEAELAAYRARRGVA